MTHPHPLRPVVSFRTTFFSALFIKYGTNSAFLKFSYKNINLNRVDWGRQTLFNDRYEYPSRLTAVLLLKFEHGFVQHCEYILLFYICVYISRSIRSINHTNIWRRSPQHVTLDLFHVIDKICGTTFEKYSVETMHCCLFGTLESWC